MPRHKVSPAHLLELLHGRVQTGFVHYNRLAAVRNIFYGVEQPRFGAVLCHLVGVRAGNVTVAVARIPAGNAGAVVRLVQPLNIY